MPKALVKRVVGVVGALGCREDVGDRLADVAELRRAEPPDVVEEGRRAEAGPHRNGRTDHDRGPPQRHERVAVEQRHRAVTDVVRRVAVPGRRHPRDVGQPALGAADGLRHAGRPGREDQQVQGLLVDVARSLHQRLRRRTARRTPSPTPRSAPSRSRGPCRRPLRGPVPAAVPRPRRPSRSSSSRSTRTSAASASPRRVGLIPTIAAPASAAPLSQNRYSGPLGRSTPTCGNPPPMSDCAKAPRAAPSATASRQVQLPPPTSNTPVLSSSARAAIIAATVVMRALLPPASAAPGSGPTRRPSPRRTTPSPVAVRSRTTPTSRPPRRRRPSPAPTATAARPAPPGPRAPDAFTTSGARRSPPST